MNADLILDVRAQLGEGPVWHPREQRLYWVDITAGLVHVHDPQRRAGRGLSRRPDGRGGRPAALGRADAGDPQRAGHV